MPHTPLPTPDSPMAASVEVFPLLGIPEVRQGDDLGDILRAALGSVPHGLQPGDVLCVSAKVISKARGLTITPDEKDRAITEASLRDVAHRDHRGTVTRIVHTRSGPIMAAAGIDASNSPDGLLLLPTDPDAEASILRESLASACDGEFGVILTDTSSRIWRMGVGDIALGASGVRVLEDLRGTRDAQGRTMGVTVRNIADEIAAASDLVKGKVRGVPASVVRGVAWAVDPAAAGARTLNRVGSDDWFPYPSLESAWCALGIPLSEQPSPQMEPEAPEIRRHRAVDIARREFPHLAVSAAKTPPARIPTPANTATPGNIPTLGNIPTPGNAATPGNPPSALDPVTVTITLPEAFSPADLVDAGRLAERIVVAYRAEQLSDELPPLTVSIVNASGEVVA